MTQAASPNSGVSVPVLVLSVLLAIATTAAVVPWLRGGSQPPSNAVAAADTGLSPQFIPPRNPPAAPDGAPSSVSIQPFTQKDTVSPGGHMTGQVYYPIPFSSPPNLKLTSGERRFDIAQQDEFGFSWVAQTRLEDFTPEHLEQLKQTKADPQSLLGGLLTAATGLKRYLEIEDFTWEAKGVRGAILPRVFEQHGTFTPLPNTEGEVTYAIPYAQGANVDLNHNSYTTVIESRANGFRWKNACAKGDETWAQREVSWTAKGIRERTVEQ